LKSALLMIRRQCRGSAGWIRSDRQRHPLL